MLINLGYHHSKPILDKRIFLFCLVLSLSSCKEKATVVQYSILDESPPA